FINVRKKETLNRKRKIMLDFFKFDTFNDGQVYRATMAVRTKVVGTNPTEITDLCGAYDSVEEIEGACNAIVKAFAIDNKINVHNFKARFIMPVERDNDRYVVVSYMFETEKDSILGAIYNTLDIYFAL